MVMWWLRHVEIEDEVLAHAARVLKEEHPAIGKVYKVLFRIKELEHGVCGVQPVPFCRHFLYVLVAESNHLTGERP
jgi:hypothetical protein